MSRFLYARAAALLPAPAAPCEPALRGTGVQTIAGRQYVVAWRAPAPLPLAEFFAVDFELCARDGGSVEAPRVDATMPEHGHGMNYRPTVAAQGKGRFRADGLLLHMPGRWQLDFAVGGEVLRTAVDVD
jgi:hypothetical protein